MNARLKAEVIAERIRQEGIRISMDDATTLRRASLALSRWGEGACGDSGINASWAIERDETTGKPYRVTYFHSGRVTRERIADRESGALRRIASVCERLGLHYYHQPDPRGCALYVSREPLTDSNYTRGVPVCV